jgi:hypothetical protein
LVLVCLLAFTLGCNGGNGGGGGTKTATVTKLTVTNGTMGRINSGTAFTFSVTVTGGTPTGMVELLDGGTMIGIAATVSGGAATLTAPASLAVGTHSITAQYLGDATTSPSATAGMLHLTVTGTTTIAITTNPAPTPAASAISVIIQ